MAVFTDVAGKPPVIHLGCQGFFSCSSAHMCYGLESKMRVPRRQVRKKKKNITGLSVHSKALHMCETSTETGSSEIERRAEGKVSARIHVTPSKIGSDTAWDQ